MGTEKRERQKVNREARRAQEVKIEQRDHLKQRVMTGLALGVLLFGGLALFWAANRGSSNAITTADEAAASSTPAPSTGCPAADGSSERITAFDEAPPLCIDPAKTYSAVISTNNGDFTIELDAAKAPNTVNNFVVLARYHYYDGVSFHRIIPDFMIQGGDAVGQPAGTGGPGYAFNDELPAPGEYEVGSVAMANSGPDTNGSQFFVVTGDAGVGLPPSYSLFGKVTDGLESVMTIEGTGTPGGAPDSETIINSVTISEQ